MFVRGHRLGRQQPLRRLGPRLGHKAYERAFHEVELLGGVDERTESPGLIRQRHYHAERPEDWVAVTGKAAQIPAGVPTVTGHQEPSTMHGAREKSLDVQNDA